MESPGGQEGLHQGKAAERLWLKLEPLGGKLVMPKGLILGLPEFLGEPGLTV